MKKLILIFFPFLFVSCSVKHKKTFDYIFNKTEAITLEQSKLTLSKDITVLSFSDSSMVDRNSSIIKVDSGWIVYSKNSESSILSFTSDGQFSGYIGHRGNGPGEYTSVYDVVVNQKSKVLEVLSDGGIFCYTFGGDFLDKKEVTYPAFSFAIDDRQNYWFYVGNNTTYGDAKMICTDENIANVAYYLHQKSNMLPMVENNFGRNGEWLTFHESPYLIELLVKKWSWWTDSNPRPADYKSAALPAELHQRVSLTLEYYIIFEKICQGKSGKYFIIPLFPISAIFPAFPQHDYPAFFGTSQGHHRRFLWRDDDFGW